MKILQENMTSFFVSKVLWKQFQILWSHDYYSLLQFGWLSALPQTEDHLMMRQVGNATSQFQKSDEDMQEWYKSYYEAINKFYDQRLELICQNPEELTDILEDLENQIQKVSAKHPLNLFSHYVFIDQWHFLW